MDLFAAFVDLSVAQSTADFAAVALSMERRDFLAKAADGSPVFLLHDASPATYSPAIELKSVSVHFHSTCRVTAGSGCLEDQFAVIACNEAVPELHEVFVRCFAAAIEQLPMVSTTTDLQRCIQGLLDLFRVLDRPSSREVAGFWAELLVISKCKDVSQALRAWHADSYERFDFSWPHGCLEVKSAIKEQRQHEFALEQLQTPIGGGGFVASILLQPMNGGVGVADLAKTIEQLVTTEPQLRQKLWENVAAALGSDFSERLDRRFDPSYAERSLAIYAMEDIPAPEQPYDPRITSVRFSVDLSSVQSSLVGSPKNLLYDLFG